jgi:hypothetical protein
MFKHYFEQVEGIATMPLISLVVGLTVWVMRAKEQYLGEMEALPLEDNAIKDSAPRQ